MNPDIPRIEAWLSSKSVTLWADWDISDPDQLRAAAEWFMWQREELATHASACAPSQKKENAVTGEIPETTFGDPSELSVDNVIRVALAEMQQQVRAVNEANGWWEDDRRFGEDIALLHSEVSEALEAFRDHGLDSVTGVNGKPEGIGSEFADVLIRLLDTCERFNVDLATEFTRKLAFNTTRGYKHGGKRL